jgi:hypothetical protein
MLEERKCSCRLGDEEESMELHPEKSPSLQSATLVEGQSAGI